MTTAVSSAWQLIPRRLSLPGRWRNPVGIAGVVIVGFVVFVALFGHLIWSYDPNNTDATRLLSPSWAHPIGTDDLGRDTLARVIAGARISLAIGFAAVGIALVLGAAC